MFMGCILILSRPDRPHAVRLSTQAGAFCATAIWRGGREKELNYRAVSEIDARKQASKKQ